MSVTEGLFGGKPGADEALGRILHLTMWVQGMKQTELAPLLGIDQSTLSKKLRGVRPWFFAEFLNACDILGVDATDILTNLWGGPGNAPPAVAPVAQRIELPPSKRKPERRKMDRLLRLAPVAA